MPAIFFPTSATFIVVQVAAYAPVAATSPAAVQGKRKLTPDKSG